MLTTRKKTPGKECEVKSPLLKEDPIYAAIGLRYPRELLICMTQKERVASFLIRGAHISVAGAWMEALTHIEQAALEGRPLPPDVTTVLRIFSEVPPEAAR